MVEQTCKKSAACQIQSLFQLRPVVVYWLGPPVGLSIRGGKRVDGFGWSLVLPSKFHIELKDSFLLWTMLSLYVGLGSRQNTSCFQP